MVVIALWIVEFVPLGAPATKRYAIAWIIFQLCALPYTTDVLHVCLLGGWVSLLTFRRPLMSILGASFRLGGLFFDMPF